MVSHRTWWKRRQQVVGGERFLLHNNIVNINPPLCPPLFLLISIRNFFGALCVLTKWYQLTSLYSTKKDFPRRLMTRWKFWTNNQQWRRTQLIGQRSPCDWVLQISRPADHCLCKLLSPRCLFISTTLFISKLISEPFDSSFQGRPKLKKSMEEEVNLIKEDSL